MEFYQRLLLETSIERQRLHDIPVIGDALRGRVSQAEYLQFLVAAYHHVKHTVPLMMACGARSAERYSWLQKPLVEYINEEIGHEQWILDDIRNAGGDPSAAVSQVPVCSAVMVSYAYDMINRSNPIGLLGMIHVLEGTSTELATRAATAIGNSLGMNATAFSYLLSHGDLDAEHVRFFRDLVNRFHSSGDQKCIIDAAKTFYLLYGNVFLDIDREIACAA